MARSTFSKVLAVVVAGALAGTSLTPLAQAQDKPAAAAKAPDKKTKDAARKAYGAGEKAYGAGKYSEAADQFKKANELIPTPNAEYWIAMSLDKAGRAEDAAAAFEKLLANPNVDKIGDDKLAEAKSRLSELKGKQVGELNVATVPPGATVSVDGQPQPGETPMILKLPPGTHKISVASTGYEAQEIDVDVTAGQRVEKSVELKAVEAAPAPATPPPADTTAPAAEEPTEKSKGGSKIPAYVTLGIAGASAVVGTFFGIKALGAKSDFNDDPTTDKADDVERNALIADMAFGVAITLGVTGVVLLTTSGGDEKPAEKAAKRRSAPRAKLNVAPFVTPHAGGAAARLTF